MKLFITDLDGTLLDKEDHASDINLQALHNLKKQGYEIVIASGRQYSVITKMGFDALSPYVISQNGSIVYDPQGNVLYKNALSTKQAYEVCCYCDEHNFLYLVYTADEMLARLPKNVMHQLYDVAKEGSQSEEELLNKMEMFYSMYATLPSFDDAQYQKVKTQEDMVYKIEVSAKNKESFKPLESHFNGVLSISSSWDTNREITASSVNKGNAVKALCEHLNLTLEDCVAIGDNQNDIEMLEYCGTSIAMGNASQAIQTICDMTTLPCVEHGVAEAIKQLLKQ